jgi:hypothetical protein
MSKEKKKVGSKLSTFFKKRATRDELVARGVLSDESYKDLEGVAPPTAAPDSPRKKEKSNQEAIAKGDRPKMQKSTTCMNSRCKKKFDLFTGKVCIR